MLSRLPSVLRLIRLGIGGELRNPGLRVLALVGILGVGAFAWSNGNIPGTTSVVLSLWLGRAYGIAAALWFGYAAIRDQDARGGAVLRVKPVDGAQWVLVMWATGVSVWLILTATGFLAAALAQLPQAGMVALASQGLAFLRAAVVVAVASTLSFTMSRIFRSPLGGIVTMFAWFCAIAGLKYIPRYLHLDYAQNQWLFAAVGLFLLGLVALMVERVRRGEFRRPLVPIVVVTALLLLAVGAGARAVTRSPALYGKIPTVWDQIASQYIEEGKRAPGFWLPDGRGGIVRTADYAGKILLIYLFPAGDLEAARVLPMLEIIASEFGEQGVQPLGVCFSPDHGDGWALARAGGYSFPIGSDLSTLQTGSPPEAAVAIAYDVITLPVLVVTDRGRRVRAIDTSGSPRVDDIRRLVEERLREEPQ